MKHDDTVYIKHIVDSVYRIENYVSDTSKNEFLSDENEMMRAAVVRELEVIGEAAKNITKEFQQTHPEILWRDITDTRNKIIHDYMSVDYDLVWVIVRQYIPNVYDQVIKIIEQHS